MACEKEGISLSGLLWPGLSPGYIDTYHGSGMAVLVHIQSLYDVAGFSNLYSSLWPWDFPSMLSVPYLLTPKDLYDHQSVTIHSSLSIWQGSSLQDSKYYSLITRSAQLRTYQALMSVFSSLQALANVNPFISDLQPDKFQIIVSTTEDIFCTIPLWQFLGH